MMIFVVWQLEILTVMLLQMLEHMSGSVLGIHACREDVARVCVGAGSSNGQEFQHCVVKMRSSPV